MRFGKSTSHVSSYVGCLPQQCPWCVGDDWFSRMSEQTKFLLMEDRDGV